jgi:hypothetical protein
MRLRPVFCAVLALCAQAQAEPEAQPGERQVLPGEYLLDATLGVPRSLGGGAA